MGPKESEGVGKGYRTGVEIKTEAGRWIGM